MFLSVCLVLFVLCIVGVTLIPDVKTNVRKEKDKNLPKMQGDFDADRQSYGQNENFYIGIIEKSKQIKIGLNTSKFYRTADNYRVYNIVTRTFDFKKLVSIEIIEDSVVVSKTNRASQIVGAGIGGALLGGTGAIIGGLSGKKTGATEIKNVTLRIVVDDYKDSVFDLPFLEKKQPIKQSSDEYRAAINSIYSWHNVLTKIIKKEDEIEEHECNGSNTITVEETEKVNNIKNKEILSNVDNNSINLINQLEKIASMKEKGFIDEIEFNKLKNKIIN